MTDIFNSMGGGGGGLADAAPLQTAIGADAAPVSADLAGFTPATGDFGISSIDAGSGAAGLGAGAPGSPAGGGSGLSGLLSAFSPSRGSMGVNVPGVAPAAPPPPAITPISGASTPAIGGPASVEASIPNASGTADPNLEAVTAAETQPQVTNTAGLGTNGGVPGLKAADLPAAPAQGGMNSFLKALLSPAGAKDPLMAGVLGLDILRGTQPPAGVKGLQALADQQKGLANTYQQEAQAEGQGLLPAGAEALVQNNLNSQIAAIRSNYAKMGMSGSSAETQDINAAKSEALAQTFQIGNTLAQQGLQEVSSATGQESALLQSILSAETAQGTQLGEALASFAGGAAK